MRNQAAGRIIWCKKCRYLLKILKQSFCFRRKEVAESTSKPGSSYRGASSETSAYQERLHPDGVSEAVKRFERGQLALQASQYEEAANLFRQSLEINPRLISAHSGLGRALHHLGLLEEAEQVLREATRMAPDDAAIHSRLGTVLRASGRVTEAEHYYRRALALQPENADILNNLGAVLNEQGRLDDAEQCFRAAVTADPRHAMAQCNLGHILADRGMQREAEACFLSAIEADPKYYYARISYVMNKLSVLHMSQTAMEQSRVQYAQALEDLCNWLPMEDDATIHAAAESVGWVTPFYLAYQGGNDRELQLMYGRLICDVMARRFPEFASPPCVPSVPPGGPLRIGVVSAFFYDHSNWKTPIRGWIENLNRSAFQVFGYYTGFRQDPDTERARRACEKFVEGMPFEALARQIRDDALHVLIFPEIGMDPLTTKLAALRLAPIQCNSWGHPDTSGMPSIDYFLSSDLMEPDDAQRYYTEQLIRLPNISIHYTPPRYSMPALSREEFGLRADHVLFCCAQSLFKYLPQFDYIFPSIAKRLDNAQFVFFASQRSGDLTETFRRRVAHAFEDAGLDASKYVVVLPRMDYATFQAAACVCDVYLDSIEWSGCNTTLESLVCHLPVITYRGSMMRGRHTYAFLKMMQLDDLIAEDIGSYIDLAVQLGRDKMLRQRIRTRIAEQLPLVCGDLECVRALEQFLWEAVAAFPSPPRELQ